MPPSRPLQCVLAIGLLAGPLQGCGYVTGFDDWANSLTSAWAGEADDQDALGRILTSAADTPGNQGLLYVATAESEIAAQAISLALARIDRPGEVQSQMGELIYALAPEAAPAWDTKSTGLVPGWEGLGYGALRAIAEMARALEQLRESQGPGAEAAGAALVCTSNALERGRRVLELADDLLDEAVVAESEALLPQMERLTRAMNAGLDQDDDGEVEVAEGECGLLTVEDLLSPVRFAT